MSLFSKDDSVKGHWQWYREFFQITFFRYLITWFAIVPILASILESLQEKLKIENEFVEVQLLDLSLPFKWELLWLSSFFFVIAFGLYLYYRPRFISVNPTYNDYLTYGHSPRWIVWESVNIVKNEKELPKFFKRLFDKGYLAQLPYEEIDNSKIIKPDVLHDQTALKFNYDGNTYQLGMPIIVNGQVDADKTKIAEKEIFWEVFGRYSSSRKIVRDIIKVLLLLSLFCFIFVLAQNIWAGLKYVYNDFFVLSLTIFK